jgi:integrase/recombinase XerD
MKNTYSLYDAEGKRLYLTPKEREAFYKAANKQPVKVRTFCHMLYHTGCRVTEALNMTYGRIDVPAGEMVILSLKKRSSKPHYRAIPVPNRYLKQLSKVHDFNSHLDERLWTWSRPHAWRLVKSVMRDAGINTKLPHATCKGLRHAFGIQAACKNVPINIIQKLLGHNSMSTTALYIDAVGAEKRELVSRMWE